MKTKTLFQELHSSLTSTEAITKVQTRKRSFAQYPTLPRWTLVMEPTTQTNNLHKVVQSTDIYDLIKKAIKPEDNIDYVENFYVICLNRANKVCGLESMKVLCSARVSTGGMTGTVADPRVILMFALMSAATSIILCHNHPSGNLRPSRADEDLTVKIKEACRHLDIKVLDHVIVSSEGYFSFADEGLL